MTLTCRSCPSIFASAKARASHERIHSGPSIADRLWSRVNKNGPVPGHRPELGPCWIWTGHTNRSGYGRMVVDGRAQGVHRIALAAALGRPLAPGMDACHSCDNPPCLNPTHLFEGSPEENISDRHEKGRDARGATNGRARLTDESVRLIRRRLTDGHAWSAIAAEFGVGKGTVQAIASGRTWSHVELAS